MKVRKKLQKLLLKLLAAVLSLALLVSLGVALVLAQPQKDQAGDPEPQPLLSPSPAVTITAESDMRTLVLSFPAPVMSFVVGSGCTFVSGTSADVAVDGGFGRIASLSWTTPDGDTVLLQSIYPASALSLLDGGYHFSNIAGPTLFGSASVRMEKSGSVRIHAATDSALYVMTLPRSLASRVSEMSRFLQLYSLPDQGSSR